MIITGGLDMDVRCVSWLPLYHDMGLMMIMFPALTGAHVTLMDPWRSCAGLTDGSSSWASRRASAGPLLRRRTSPLNLTAERGLPPKGEDLDLSNVVCLLNGSEPVTMSAVEKFTKAFAPYGLPATAVKPSYGMAEATLSVASIHRDAAASAIFLDREQLGAGRAVTVAPGTPGAVAHVSCGQPIPDQWLVIASPDGAEVPDGTVGEIWLHGNNIGRGYFGREEETQRIFGNKLQSRLDHGSHAEGAPDNGCWLATGDLGVYVDGELYLTGRIKDLIIIDGRNHYPHDIETTVSDASSAIRTGYVAAFSVPGDALDGVVRPASRWSSSPSAAPVRGPCRAGGGRRGRSGGGLPPTPDPDRRLAAGRRWCHSAHDEREAGPRCLSSRLHRRAVQPLTGADLAGRWPRQPGTRFGADASSMSAVGPANDNRTNLLPRAVSKSMPGAMATPVSANNFEQNAIESPVKSETSA